MVPRVLRRVALMFLFCMLAPAVVPFSGLALAPLQDDAGSGGDAGDDHAHATPLTPGAYEGRLELPHDAADIYAFDVVQGDAIHLDLEASGLAEVLLHLRVPIRGPADAAPRFTSYGSIAPGANMTVYAPYSGTWYVEVLGPPVWAFGIGWSDYGFGLSVVPDVAVVSVFDAPAAVLEVEGFDGRFQYHIDAVLPGGEPAVLSLRNDGATPHEDDWFRFTFGLDLVRTAWGETLLSTSVPDVQDLANATITLGSAQASVMGTMKSASGSAQRIDLMSSGASVRITFAAPHGALTKAAAADAILFRSVEDLRGGTLRTPVFQDLGGASDSFPLAPAFRGHFFDWDENVSLVAPDGSVHQRLPAHPQEGTWRIEATQMWSYAPDSDMPLIWGASYPDLGIWPGVETDYGFFMRFIFRPLTPV